MVSIVVEAMMMEMGMMVVAGFFVIVAVVAMPERKPVPVLSSKIDF